ncbi:MAG: hypothetical protein MR352_04545 [Ruminococcus sp.]|nr:hypothetical protein [Ruminococcus sp.]MCI5617326.1 hypothetical protein [Ruminococcus sp.]
MEKKRIIKTSGLFILLCVVAFCVEFYYANNTKNIILPEKSEIYTVTVTNGTSGNTTTVEESNINKIYNDLKNISLTKVDNEDLSGWNYSVDIETNNDTDVHLVFLFDKLLQYNNNTYEINGTSVLENFTNC